MQLILLLLLLLPSICHADTQSNLTLWYKLDDGSGTTPVDSSGNGNNGTTLNSPGWVTNCPRNNCMSFNFSNQSITSSSAINPFPLSFTYSAWMYLINSVTTKQVVMARNTQGSGIEVVASGLPNFYSFNGVGGAQAIGGACPAFTLNKWYHYVGTYDGTTFRVYVNGAQCDSAAFSGYSNANSSSMIVGANGTWTGGGSPFGGYIDDVRIYSRALSAQDVLDLYNAPILINNATLNNFTISN